MKKYFMFVAVAAAGMLASCSSDSLTAGSDPTIEPTQEERVPIQLGVSSPSVNLPSGTTRGTGTVGGVGTGDTNNKWYGHKINVFMFTKDKDTYATTLNLTLADPDDASSAYYNDAVMITPGTSDNKIPGQDTPTDIGEAMLSNGTIQYYPMNGNFDFFGYHGDDAVTAGTVVTTADPWVVPFTITGSQDLMSTKAELTSTQATTLGDGYKDYYSAKAARKSVQPVLSFKHLLTRLSFVIVPGNDNAGGWIAASTYTAAEANSYNAGLSGAIAPPTIGGKTAAYNLTLPGAIKSGEALTAEQAAKYNATLSGALHEHDADPGDFNTKVGHAPVNPADLTAAEADEYNATLSGAKSADDTLSSTESNTYNKTLPGAKTSTYDPLSEDEANAYNATLTGAVHEGEEKAGGAAHQDPDRAVYVNAIKVTSKNSGNMKVAWTGANPAEMITWDDATGDLVLKERPYAYKTDTPATIISETAYNKLPASDPGAGGDWQGNYTLIGSNTNYELIDLNPTYPKMNYSTLDTDPTHKNDPTSVGEALIVAPKDGDYEMEVSVTQKVPTNWTTPTVLTPKSQTYKLKINKPEGGFKENTSYQVKLTVYGFERIVVTTEIIPWTQGATIPVGQD